MKFNELTRGKSYKVTFTGTVHHVASTDDSETLFLDNAGNYHYFDHKTDVEFELAGPENWPPQENDVWEGDGSLVYHCIGGKLYRDSVGKSVTISNNLVIAGNLNLQLVFRKS
jgi:hypothetical protein